MTPDQRLALIQQVLAKAYQQTESWREHHLGAHLAYLCLAIADAKPDSFVDWSPEETGRDECTAIVLHLFLDWFPPEHPVWQFIRVKS